MSNYQLLLPLKSDIRKASELQRIPFPFGLGRYPQGSAEAISRTLCRADARNSFYPEAATTKRPVLITELKIVSRSSGLVERAFLDNYLNNFRLLTLQL